MFSYQKHAGYQKHANCYQKTDKFSFSYLFSLFFCNFAIKIMYAHESAT